ncbi:hypothetical protein [Actinomycetospora sp. CA-084318]|uniref:hypothetical protein n=1 Tax=Actinomycetospora sp. CA-084318 TaxID=3239892 RepID=UPI003D96FDFC
MENADHVDLATWLRTHGALPAPIAVAVVRQLADTMDATPDTHGDIAAADVVLHVADGLRPDASVMRADLSRTEAAGDRPDRRSDVAALGWVLHAALTGDPSTGRDADGPRVALPDLNPDVSARLHEVIATATSPDRATRYGRAGALAAAAETALEQPPAATTGAPDTLVRPVGSTVAAEAPTRSGEPDAPSPGTLVRPLLSTADAGTTLDRPIELTKDAGGTLNRPIEPTGDAGGTLNRPIEPSSTGLAPGSGGSTVPGWTTTSTAASTSGAGSASRRGRRTPTVVVLLAVVLLVGAVAWFVLQPSDLEVVGATVVPATGSSPTCDATVDLLGTIRTNGRGGTITYSWSRSDGSETDSRNEQLADGVTSVDVHLLWQITGRGRYPANATLRVSEPNATEARTEFVYDCR